MIEIEFSVMVDDASQPQEGLRAILDEFERQHHIKVHLTIIGWASGWSEIMKYGLYGQGPDVSEIGTTWLGGIAAMNALRPFKPADMRTLGKPEDFLENSWQSCTLKSDSTLWAIPWQTDTRLFYYRSDMFDRAGITDHQSVFTSHDSLVQALAKILKSGLVTPITLVVQRNYNSVYEIASWVWGAGGHFMAPDGQSVVMNQSEALKGLHNYFSLRSFLGDVDWDAADPYEPFTSGQTAMAINGPFMLNEIRGDDPEMAAKIQVSLAPGIPFVGGTNLMIWKHTRQPRAAVELVNFLTRQEARYPYIAHSALLPARISVLDELQKRGDPLIETSIKSLYAGQSFSNNRMWGYIEEKLFQVLPTIWRELIENPDADLDEIIKRNIDFFVRRANLTLSH